MTSAILLDTHILLWFASGGDRLQPRTHGFIDQHWRNGGRILVSAVTTWKTAMLADAGRIHLDCPTEEWMERCLNQPGFDMVPLSWRACVRAYELHHFKHRDPADRLLVATAIELACTFVTYDERIARFASTRGRQHGLRLAG